MIVEESVGDEVSVKGDLYTLVKDSSVVVLRRIKIRKKPLVYAFIGGMWYSKSGFSFEQNISLPYPFSTYYTFKILDKKYNGVVCRSLLYVKTPVIVVQFKDECVAVEFTPLVEVNEEEVFPFVSL
ncbi:MAG: hypothetical protein ACXQS2_04695, partial [Methermicoccaceae archaeon]